MSVDPKYLIAPESIEDTADFLANTFFPKGEIDPVNFQVVMQWVMARELEDEEVSFALEKFYQKMMINAHR